jgi:hypothetical protein
VRGTIGDTRTEEERPPRHACDQRYLPPSNHLNNSFASFFSLSGSVRQIE